MLGHWLSTGVGVVSWRLAWVRSTCLSASPRACVRSSQAVGHHTSRASSFRVLASCLCPDRGPSLAWIVANRHLPVVRAPEGARPVFAPEVSQEGSCVTLRPPFLVGGPGPHEKSSPSRRALGDLCLYRVSQIALTHLWFLTDPRN